MAHRRPRLIFVSVLVTTVLAGALSGCQSTSSGTVSGTQGGSAPRDTASGAVRPGSPSPAVLGVGDPSSSSSPSSGPALAGSALLSISPAAAGKAVRADRPVAVSVVNGELTSVMLTTADGVALAGAKDATGTWRNTDPLSAGTRYTVTAQAKGLDGVLVRESSTFATKSAASLVRTTLIPGDDWEVGVGMPVIVVFSRPVTNRAAAEAAMSVTSTPAVEGGWRWFSSTEAHWRPVAYWPSGTKVTVKAATSGVELAKGAWGRRTVTTRFTVARSQLMTVDMVRHTLTVQRGDQVVRTIPVTTGKRGFASRNGIKVVMDRQSEVRMDAASTGTDAKDPEYYNLLVNWAMRLTWSGEYLHAAPWSVGSQGRANVSHGCTGMSTANAKWLYDNVRIGDVVTFTGGSRKLEWGNGYTDWNLPFPAYDSGA